MPSIQTSKFAFIWYSFLSRISSKLTMRYFNFNGRSINSRKQDHNYNHQKHSSLHICLEKSLEPGGGQYLLPGNKWQDKKKWPEVVPGKA